MGKIFKARFKRLEAAFGKTDYEFHVKIGEHIPPEQREQMRRENPGVEHIFIEPAPILAERSVFLPGTNKPEA